MAWRELGSAELRGRLAQEAARIISEQGIQDYGLAKRKAAQRLGVREASVLPSNSEIETCVTEWQQIFEPEGHRNRLKELRCLAVDIMTFLSPFEPRLTGSVLTGAITANSPIEIHLFTDAPEEVILKLEESVKARMHVCKRCFLDQKTTQELLLNAHVFQKVGVLDIAWPHDFYAQLMGFLHYFSSKPHWGLIFLELCNKCLILLVSDPPPPHPGGGVQRVMWSSHQ